ncbi:hypothetical protein DOS62_06665 [Staphylococcus felis]|uniref:HK97 gp10 family phage protein n=1 Tax=Staphylococcus felis TaxID=46127 RepID=A0ABS0QP83_9STAP|nr:HK97-gp10 family putative phage morphogenesis protein [Staphylococcus felis]MBH9580882.1 HK97 gp10 family phage protein [Staphylococcus felis]REI04067.1 hypothetical protein DOS62_06665 [Staphylococcus felis]
MKVDGLDDLLDALYEQLHDIDDDVDEVLEDNAKDYVFTAKKTASEVMNKGYWTGNLWRMIDYEKTGHLEYTVTSNAAYSGFLEFGTRYMEAEPFMWPTYIKIQGTLKKDLEELVNG